MMRTALISLGALALTACGNKTELEPPAGASLPPAPYGGAYTPSASELLEPPVLAVPERDIELRERSEEREDDPFDLPPPDTAPDER